MMLKGLQAALGIIQIENGIEIDFDSDPEKNKK